MTNNAPQAPSPLPPAHSGPARSARPAPSRTRRFLSWLAWTAASAASGAAFIAALYQSADFVFEILRQRAHDPFDYNTWGNPFETYVAVLWACVFCFVSATAWIASYRFIRDISKAALCDPRLAPSLGYLSDPASDDTRVGSPAEAAPAPSAIHGPEASSADSASFRPKLWRLAFGLLLRAGALAVPLAILWMIGMIYVPGFQDLF